MSLSNFPDNWIDIATNTAKKIAPKFVFGSYTVEDLVQHGLYVVMNEADRYNSERGTFVTFCYILIRSRLHSLKRNQYERPDPPCARCPLHAWIPEQKKCSLFNDLSLCSIYHKWELKNEHKRLLSGPCESVSEREGGCAQSGLEMYDFILWLGKIVNDKEGLNKLVAGESLPTARRIALMIELRECVEGEDLG